MKGEFNLGFFDEFANDAKQNMSRESLIKEVHELHETYVNTFRELEVTENYKREIIVLKDNSLQEFKDYFQEKDFEVSASELEFSNSKGYTATLGELEVNFTYLRHLHYEINLLPYLIEPLSVEDLKGDDRNFKGYLNIYTKKIIIFGNHGKEDESVYNKAKEDLKKDIEILNEKIKSKYTPKLAIYIKRRDMHVNNIIEYLDLLDQEMEWIKYEYIFNTTFNGKYTTSKTVEYKS